MIILIEGEKKPSRADIKTQSFLELIDRLKHVHQRLNRQRRISLARFIDQDIGLDLLHHYGCHSLHGLGAHLSNSPTIFSYGSALRFPPQFIVSGVRSRKTVNGAAKAPRRCFCQGRPIGPWIVDVSHLMAAQSLILCWAQQARIADLHAIAESLSEAWRRRRPACAEIFRRHAVVLVPKQDGPVWGPNRAVRKGCSTSLLNSLALRKFGFVSRRAFHILLA